MDLDVTGAFIYFTIPIFGGINVTQTMVSQAIVTALLCWAFIYFGKNLKKRPDGKQVLVEKGVMMLQTMVAETMGAHNLHWTPFIGTIFLSSICGSFIGIRSTHTKAHFTRSVLEGVAYSLLHSKMKLNELGIMSAKRATLIGGGAKSKVWQQVVADCLGIELIITLSSDSSLGSAMLAGIAMGVFKDANEAVNKCIKVKTTVIPNAENTKEYSKRFEEYVRVHDALAPIYKERNQ